MKTIPRAASCVLVVAMAGCGGSGGGGEESTSSQVQFLVGDAPTDDLLSFEVAITGLTLTDDDAEVTDNLLFAAHSVNLLNLGTQSALIEIGDVPPEAFVSGTVFIDESSIRARARDGRLVPVLALVSSATADFPAPVALKRGDKARLHFEIDLEQSLFGDLSLLVFVPVLVLTRPSNSSHLPIDEIEGTVLATNPSTGRLLVDLRDTDSDAFSGELIVKVDDATLLLDDDGRWFNNASAFFAVAKAGLRIEARGEIVEDGVFLASSVQIEDKGGGSSAIAGIKGVVTEVDLPQQTFGLRIVEIRKNHALIESVLGALGNPPEIAVDLFAARIIIEGREGGPGDPSDLVPGQAVHVKFSAFQSSPFPARKVEIEREKPDFEGTIFDVGGIPGAFVVHLEEHDPAVVSGRVDSADTDVEVQLDEAVRVFLGIDGEPGIDPGALRSTLPARIRGTLGGTSSSPVIDAEEVRVRPGRIENGLGYSGNRGARTFEVEVGVVTDSWGEVLAEVVTATFADNAVVEGEADSIEEFYDLLDQSPSLKLRLAGLADDPSNITVHEVEVQSAN